MFLPITARLYPVDVLGHYYTLLSAITLAGAALTLRLEMALVPASPADRDGVLAACLRNTALLAGLATLLWVLFVLYVPTPGGLAGWTVTMKSVLAVSVFASALSVIAGQALLAAGRYGLIARNRIAQVLASNGLVVVAGWWWPRLEVLVVAQLLASLMLLHLARDLFAGALRWPVGAAEIGAATRRNIDFIRWNFPANLLNTASLQLPTILLAGLFGPASAVCYALAGRLCDLAFTTLSAPMSQVFYREAAARVRSGERPVQLVLGTMAISAVAGLAISAVFLLFADVLVRVVLGSNWALVSEVMTVILAFRLAQFVNQPLSTIYSVVRRQRLSLLLVALFFLPRLWALVSGADFLDALWRYTVASAGFYITYTLAGVWLALREVRHE